MIILSIIGVIVILLGAIGARLIYLALPTKGVAINKYETSNSALLVIDMQNDTLSVPQYKNMPERLENINTAIDYAEAKGIPTIYIKQEFHNVIDTLLSGGMYRKNGTGVSLSNQLHVVTCDIFSKFRSDAFSCDKFEGFLINNQIGTLYLVGADASACIYKTALGGINRKYEFVAIEDCLLAADIKNIDKILENYNDKGIKVIPIEKFIIE